MNRPEAMTNVDHGLDRAERAACRICSPIRCPTADRVVGLSLIYHSKREGDYLTGIAGFTAATANSCAA